MGIKERYQGLKQNATAEGVALTAGVVMILGSMGFVAERAHEGIFDVTPETQKLLNDRLVLSKLSHNISAVPQDMRTDIMNGDLEKYEQSIENINSDSDVIRVEKRKDQLEKQAMGGLGAAFFSSMAVPYIRSYLRRRGFQSSYGNESTI